MERMENTDITEPRAPLDIHLSDKGLFVRWWYMLKRKAVKDKDKSVRDFCDSIISWARECVGHDDKTIFIGLPTGNDRWYPEWL